ncbi:hypothetical protein K502DRAFT_12950 [Neoconidiobolus thromboides FSU 785]|nr:hypothetical protein K502DRAFT_12950 [Neoconidiobolus thromboides FSU 785]
MSTNNNESVKLKEKNRYTKNTILKLIHWASKLEKLRLMDLNTTFCEIILRQINYEFTEEWVEYNEEKAEIEMEESLVKYGGYVRRIMLTNSHDLPFYETLFKNCKIIYTIKIEQCPVNEVLDLVYKYYGTEIRHLTLGSPVNKEITTLAQIPKFPKILTLRINRMNIETPCLQEILFFLNDSLKTLSLGQLTLVEDNTIRYIENRFPELDCLDLATEAFYEEGLLALEKSIHRYKELSFGALADITKNTAKLKLLNSKIPKLKRLKIVGSKQLIEEGIKFSQLLVGSNYGLSTISLARLNMDVEYYFTMQRFPQLVTLTLDNCANLSIEHVTTIFQHPTLRTLSLNGNSITDEHFSLLVRRRKMDTAPIANLATLAIRGAYPIGFLFLSYLVMSLLNVVTLDITSTRTRSEIPVNTMMPQLMNLNTKPLKLGAIGIKGSFIDNVILEALLIMAPDLKVIKCSDSESLKKHLSAKHLLKKDLIIFTEN